ncbi:MAG: hypothetical protein WCL32_19995, partial [Planctomycetota bacterium]
MRLGLAADANLRGKLSSGPLPYPRNWLTLANASQMDKDLAALRRSVARSCPYGGETWTASTTAALGLQST